MTFPPFEVLLPLVLVVILAFAIETSLGFGAALVTVALGSFVIGIQELLPALVPLNLVLSFYLVSRYHREIDRAYFLQQLLPAMALGMPIGLALFSAADTSLLKRIFGAFVLLAAVSELVQMRSGTTRKPLETGPRLSLLFLGGGIHGAFSTGGPVAVYVTGRVIADKAKYRATLSALWAVLGTILVVTYAATGRMTAASGTLSLSLLPAIVAGVVAGGVAFRRVPAQRLKEVVFAMLAVTGLVLTARGSRCRLGPRCLTPSSSPQCSSPRGGSCRSRSSTTSCASRSRCGCSGASPSGPVRRSRARTSGRSPRRRTAASAASSRPR